MLFISLISAAWPAYNEAKGITFNLDMFHGENELKIHWSYSKIREVVVLFVYDDDELIGIDKTVCSKIRITMLKNGYWWTINFLIPDPDGDIFPEKWLT